MVKSVHDYRDLIRIFDNCFFETYNTRLVRGGDEPSYQPADTTRSYHAIFFAHGFFSSALHECAHWLLAGYKRRQLEDFGYWYVPDDLRTAAEQAAFLKMEVKPQALEWILSQATAYRFRVSIDNLNGTPTDTTQFKESVYHQVLHYCQQGLPPRAAYFYEQLSLFFKTPNRLHADYFALSDLDWFKDSYATLPS